MPPRGATRLALVRHQLDLDRLRVNRNTVIEELKEDRISTSVHFIPLHLHPYYRHTLQCTPADFPRATAAFERIISLPIYPKMTAGDVQKVITAVRKIIERGRR
jgi:dTDP-4-amino-4,6-dideoxygalactose transaminase